MTLNEARYVVRNRYMYSDDTLRYALEILERAGEEILP